MELTPFAELAALLLTAALAGAQLDLSTLAQELPQELLLSASVLVGNPLSLPLACAEWW